MDSNQLKNHLLKQKQEDKELTIQAINLMKVDGKEPGENFLDDIQPYIKEAEKKLKKIKTTPLTIQNFIQNVESFYELQPFFYDKSLIFWMWNSKEYKYEMTDDIDLMNLIESELELNGQTVNGNLKSGYIEAFKRVGRLHKPLDPPKTWIQFKDKIIDIKTNQTFKATPQYFITNPIPWEMGLEPHTPVLNQLFSEWVGNDHLQTLIEIIAYSVLPDYPIHTMFALIGSGRNGKSRYLELINRFVGKSNVTSTELDDLLENRFEKAKLYKKLVCVMGETNFGTIKKTSLLKKLTGQDLIGYEFKNKNPFDDYNYAKILISSNSLPSSDDTSEGFYRRWIIIKFPNNFPEGKDILDIIPEIEYNNLACKIIIVLKQLLNKCHFTNQGSIEDRKQNYIMASNPLSYFIKEHCILNENGFIKYSELYSIYSQYLLKNKQRVVSKNEFSSILNSEGFIVDKTSKQVNGEWVNSRWVLGLFMKPEEFVTLVTDVTDVQLSSSRIGKELESESQVSQESQEKPTLISYGELENILLDKKEGWSFIDAINFGFDKKDLKKWMSEGLIFESPKGTIRLLN